MKITDIKILYKNCEVPSEIHYQNSDNVFQLRYVLQNKLNNNGGFDAKCYDLWSSMKIMDRFKIMTKL